MGRKLALLIGNGMYKQLPRLEKYKADVTFLAQALRASDIGAFDEVQELIDQSSQVIKREIAKFFVEDKKEKDDLLLLYLSGHGEIDVNNSRWYFTGVDTDTHQLFSTAISASFIHEVLDSSRSQRLILVIDACYSSVFLDGAKGHGDIAQDVIKQFGYGKAVLVAASRNERAWENDKLIPLSNFTYHLVQGLTTGAADKDQNGRIDVDEWFDYADEQVRNESPNQTPRKHVETRKGPLYIANNPTWKSGIDVLNQSQKREVDPPIPIRLKDTSGENVSEDTPLTFSIGGQKVNLIILARGYYGPQEVLCFYERTAHLPADLQRMRSDYERNNKEQKAKGVMGLPYNSPMYKLREFDIGHRNIIEGEEVPALRLKFGPTDYFSQIVTDLNVGDPVREKYLAKAGPITEHPVPEFSTILGVNLNVITADNYLVITERSQQAKVAGGKLHTSVGENLLRPKDSGVSYAPDPFLALTRGAKEELGIVLDKDNMVFRTFTVIPDYCQYSLIATIRIQEKRSEVEEIWRSVVPADKWESRRLLFYSHDPDTIAQFVVSTWGRWFHVALAAVVFSLWDVGYTQEKVDMAFLEARSKLSL